MHVGQKLLDGGMFVGKSFLQHIFKSVPRRRSALSFANRETFKLGGAFEHNGVEIFVQLGPSQFAVGQKI